MSAGAGIGDLYHVLHAGDELAPMDEWYDAVFSPRRGILDDDYFEPQKRQASMMAIADCMVEAMAPRKDVAGWESTPMGRFNARFGSHWHSIAFYAEDVGALWDRLIDHGVRVVKGGRPEDGVDGRPGEFTPIYTHPRDTLTQLEFARRRPRHGVRDFTVPGEVDPRYLPGWSSDWWCHHHPLGIERMSYITVVTADDERACRMFVDVLGGVHLGEARSSLTRTRDIYIALGTQTVLQLSIPDGDDGSLAGAEMARHGDALHALAFTVRDLDAAARFLAETGIAIAARDDETILVDPASSLGAPYRFTTFRTPGDPRQLPDGRTARERWVNRPAPTAPWCCGSAQNLPEIGSFSPGRGYVASTRL